MLFSSFEFIFLFLPITFFIYFYLNKKRLSVIAKIFLVVSSLFFYAYWNVAYLLLILISMIFNYSIGLMLNKNNINKKLTLIFGITANLALLGYFKYADFLIDNINFALNTQIANLNLLLPLAISFFTFQQIAYLVDTARNERERESKNENFLDYCLFVTFFPQLIAGPIVHHKEMMPQFANIQNKIMNYKNIAIGLFIFSIGLFKKVVIADTFAAWATNGFDKAQILTLFEAWGASLSYTFQLYFDFSGYCDMAIGAALLFNIKLPINFNSPYKALDIQDFWRRWHITLGRFLKDYVYIPLGGNRKGKLRTYANLMATFIIGGIWHGAGWTFVFWGFLHGVALVIHRIWSELGFKMNKILAWFITFNFINFTWIFFRAKEWDDAIKVLKGMIGMNGVVFSSRLEKKLAFLSNYDIKFDDSWIENIHASTNLFYWFAVLIIVILTCKNSYEISNNSKKSIFAVIYAILFLFSIAYSSVSNYSEFIYFNF